MINAFANMVGVTMSSISGGDKGSDVMTFHGEDGRRFTFWHEGDCCECVCIEDVVGDLEDLIGSPIVYAEEVSNRAREARLDRLSSEHTFRDSDLAAQIEEIERGLADDPSVQETPVDSESYTWTFYRFATAKGHVTVRWLGTSNGYYSECVSYREEPS
jgi:hypothetical protein